MPRDRKLNIPLAKGVVMGALALALGVAAALSGIGPQVAAAPVIAFMLGLTEERTRGTAIAFSLCAAIGGVIGAVTSGVDVDLGYVVLLFLGATAGAVFTARLGRPEFAVLHRTGQSLGILIGVFVVGEAVRHRIGGARPLHLEAVQAVPWVGALILGCVAGALSNALQLSSGVLLVPALLYLADPAGITAPRPTVAAAVAMALCVAAFGSFLPVLAYSARQAIDRRVGPWMAAGGLAGGVIGGIVLGHLRYASTVPLIVFGVSAMFLSAWRISRS